MLEKLNHQLRHDEVHVVLIADIDRGPEGGRDDANPALPELLLEIVNKILGNELPLVLVLCRVFGESFDDDLIQVA